MMEIDEDWCMFKPEFTIEYLLLLDDSLQSVRDFGDFLNIL